MYNFKLLICSVYDSKAEGFLQPFFAGNEAIAIRMFSTKVNEPHHVFNSNPGDFTCFALGEFDVQTGKFELLGAPENLGVGTQFLKHGGSDV